MKVVDLINKLNEIGYDENTELTFSCVDGNSGECYEVPFDEISFGENLTVEEVEINHFFFVAEMRWIMNWADIKMEIPNMQVDLYVWGVWVKIC